MLQRSRHVRQKCVRLECVQRTMIDGQREITHRPYADGFTGVGVDYTDSALHLSHAENGDLGLINDDRRRQQASAHAVVGDRKGAASHLLRGKFVRARGLHC